MNTTLKAIILASSSALMLQATPLPVSSSKPEVNLENYLKYESQNNLSLTCKDRSDKFVCISKDQKISEVDDDNVTTHTEFKKAELRFDHKLKDALNKKFFADMLKEIDRCETSDYEITELQDLFSRAMAENLKYIEVDELDVKVSDPKSHVHVKEIVYENKMKRKAKSIEFDERILGLVEIHYTDVMIDSDDDDFSYNHIPEFLEELFGTDDKKRSAYVGEKLTEIYSKYSSEPLNGYMSINTKYLGNDTLSVDMKVKNTQGKITAQNFDFSGEIRNISAVVQSSNKNQASVMPDFLFKSLSTHSKNGSGEYKKLIKKDKKFAKYISEYNTLLNNYFDKELKQYTKNAIIKKWLNQAKTAFSKIIMAKADTLDISIKNRTSVTAMQLFGMVMGQMMTLPQQGDSEAQQTKIILDTAAQNLDIKIEAH